MQINGSKNLPDNNSRLYIQKYQFHWHFPFDAQALDHNKYVLLHEATLSFEHIFCLHGLLEKCLSNHQQLAGEQTDGYLVSKFSL